MQRAPVVLGWGWFAVLCASLAYWGLQWFAPAPRAVAAPPEAVRPLPSVASAAALFGGRPQEAGGTQLQLRGIVFAGRSSMAIIAAEGKPARAWPVDAEVLPGLKVKQIAARSVLLSEHGNERELALPPFAAQEAGGASPQVGLTPELPQGQPQPQPQPSQPVQAQPSASVPASAPSAGPSAGASAGASSAGSEAGTLQDATSSPPSQPGATRRPGRPGLPSTMSGPGAETVKPAQPFQQGQ